MIRPLVHGDLDAALAVNQGCVPEVGPLDAARLASLVAASPWSRVVEVDGSVAGLLIGLVDGAHYDSPNYRWFAQRHQRFAYVDRIALVPAARGAGHGLALYRAFEEWARTQHRSVLCAEVNVRPPNPRSLRFHQRFGFVEVAQQDVYGSYRVAMVEKVLLDPSPGPQA